MLLAQPRQEHLNSTVLQEPSGDKACGECKAEGRVREL